MKIEVKKISADGTMTIKFIEFTGELQEKQPEEGKQYIVYFEKSEPDPIPEFNQ